MCNLLAGDTFAGVGGALNSPLIYMSKKALIETSYYSGISLTLAHSRRFPSLSTSVGMASIPYACDCGVQSGEWVSCNAESVHSRLFVCLQTCLFNTDSLTRALDTHYRFLGGTLTEIADL